MVKKVVWIVNEYNFPDDRNTRQTNLCRLLNEHGYDCYLISGSTSNKSSDNRITNSERICYVETDEARGYIVKTPNYKKSYARVFVSILFQLRAWKYRKILPMPDVIVSDFAGLFGNGFFKWKKKYGTRIILDILDLWPEGFVAMGLIRKESPITRFLYALEHKSYREADGIIFSFQGGRDYLIDKGWSKEVGGDVDTSNIGYLNNGVNLNIVDKQREDHKLADNDLDSDKFKVIYLGSVSYFNGLDVLVETAKILQNRGINSVVILVYGYGNQEEILKEQVEKYDLRNIVFKGKLEKEYAMNVLSRGNLNLFTFKDSSLLRYGVSPNKLFMYFASGRPVLSMIKPNYDLVLGKEAGVSVDNDPEIVADAIVDFCCMNSNMYERFCKNARAIAEEYDYEKLIKVLIEKIEG